MPHQRPADSSAAHRELDGERQATQRPGRAGERDEGEEGHRQPRAEPGDGHAPGQVGEPAREQCQPRPGAGGEARAGGRRLSREKVLCRVAERQHQQREGERQEDGGAAEPDPRPPGAREQRRAEHQRRHRLDLRTEPGHDSEAVQGVDRLADHEAVLGEAQQRQSVDRAEEGCGEQQRYEAREPIAGGGHHGMKPASRRNVRATASATCPSTVMRAFSRRSVSASRRAKTGSSVSRMRGWRARVSARITGATS